MVELLAVLAILSVLALGVMPLAENAQNRMKERELRRALWQIRDAIDDYKRAVESGAIAAGVPGSVYPPSLSAMVDGAEVLGSGGARRVFLRQVPRDPWAPDAMPAEQTWALRSFESSAERPRPGRDVYDIHSRSERLGSNGLVLSRW